MKEISIVRATPFKGFNKEKIIYIPFDPVPGFLKERIEGRAVRSLETGAGILYLLEDKLVLYRAIGAPAAALGLESLAAGGMKAVTVLSFCGSLVHRLKIGDVVSVSRALTDEGTSPRYFAGQEVFYPSASLKAGVEVKLRESGLGYAEAVVVSTDAPYRETASWLAGMVEKDVDGVDMETSAVFCLARFHGFEAAALMIVSDELSSGTWKSRFPRKLLEQKVEDYFMPFL